jgi:hypothetical protein
MKTNIVGLGDAKRSPNRNETKIRVRRLSVFLLLFSAIIGAGGCNGYYAGYPGYGPYYGSAPYYGGGPGRVVVEVGDRPYYRGAGYWRRGAYYVWRPGHWTYRYGRRVWIRGHYVLR